jgi:hypothetical protein
MAAKVIVKTPTSQRTLHADMSRGVITTILFVIGILPKRCALVMTAAPAKR